MKKIGFIGLGIMGKPMALNLIKKGLSLSVYSRRANSTEQLVQAGATAFTSPQDLAATVDTIITMLPATADVEEMLIGRHGIIHTAKPGTLIIDMSTLSIQATQRFAQLLEQKSLDMLDAPVSGGEQGAIAGTLSIMVGGKAAVLKKALPIFEALGKQIIHIGDHGAGQIAKACNQIVIAETIVAVSEALHLAKASGVDVAKVRDALLGGFANSRVLEIHGKRMLDRDYQPGFKASLHRKDMHIALEQAHLAQVDLPAAHHAMQCLDRLVMKGNSDLDSAAIHLMTED